MEISSQMTKPEGRWRRPGVTGVSGGANLLTSTPGGNLTQQQQLQQQPMEQHRIDAMTRNLTAVTLAAGDGVVAGEGDVDPGVVMPPPSGVAGVVAATNHADGVSAPEDGLAPLPSEGRFASQADRRKVELKNRKTSTAAAAAAAGLKTLPGTDNMYFAFAPVQIFRHDTGLHQALQ